MDIGYARVSTSDQDHAGQVEALEQLGCEKVFAEKISGKDKDGRSQLRAMLDFARQGDKVHVTKLDRLARNARDALEIADHLHAKGAGLVIHDFGSMDITTDVGRLVYTVLAAVAEMERSRIRERQREGIERAKAEGRQLGRTEALSDDQKQQVRELVAQGVPKARIAHDLGVSRTTVYKALGSAC